MRSRSNHNKSISSHTSNGNGIFNRTYLRNKEYGFPAGANNLIDSTHFPTRIESIKNTESKSPIISVPIGAYASFVIETKIGYLYFIDTDKGYGTSIVIGSPIFAGTGKDVIFSVKITSVGVSNVVQLAVKIKTR